MEPDDKEWTWVLDRRCSDCGFDASTCTPESVAALVRESAGAWKELWIGDGIRPSRSDPTAWSSLEYACHARDVYLPSTTPSTTSAT